jgi:sugar phosphate isomerase/epimerase
LKLGMSSYSLHRAIESGEMTVPDVIRWTSEQGGEHIEIVPIAFNLVDNPGLIDTIRQTADEAGIEISNYAVGGNFVAETDEQYRVQIEQVKRHVDIASRLGVRLMRHDAASRPKDQISIRQFEGDLPRIAEACGTIADYAKAYGITTSVENHGFYLQAADRVQQLLHEVNRENFKTTLDVGNFMCVDEDPVASTVKNLPYASMVHLKDFYLRPSTEDPGEGWFTTAAGNYLRGAIAGQGDVNLRQILLLIKQSGYDGYVSLEFEGMEDCKTGSRIGLDNIRRLWDEV